ncbi:MAG: arsenosugar biosynthesis radical SAM (seleno)protein ArsS, partial [Gammaproteobacteria bacterium]
MHETLHLLEKTDFPKITRSKVETLQVNVGYKCNQTCTHCHVNAGPNRKEMMTAENISAVFDYIRAQNIQTLDLTGGAPELHPQFRDIVTTVRSMNCRVMDRCNLTVLEEPGQEDTAEFLTSNQVSIIASLPCYTEDNVDKQRGKGVFEKSIRGLKTLNALGYGKGNADLKLTLVYNPQGPFLPPSQETLKSDYTKFLAENFNISFDELFTITNMPIQRFGSMLVSKGKFEEYMQLLRDAYSADNLHSLMCRT